MRFLIFILIFFTQCLAPLTKNSVLPSPLTSDSLPLLIIAIDVGQGDATLIRTPSQKNILIDGGKPESGVNKILPLLSQLGITKLDIIFTSHYDADHMGGIAEVVAGPDQLLETDDDYFPQITYDRGDEDREDNERTEKYLSAVGSSRRELNTSDRIDMKDGVTFECIIINGQDGDNSENDRSMGLLMSYGHFHYFTAGDLPGGGMSGNQIMPDLEALIIPMIGAVDVLHVSHHGSETSTSENLVSNLSPMVAIISVGNENTYGHPHPEVLHRLIQHDVQIYQTERGNSSHLPNIHVINGSVMTTVNEDGSYQVQTDFYQAGKN